MTRYGHGMDVTAQLRHLGRLESLACCQCLHLLARKSVGCTGLIDDPARPELESKHGRLE